MLKTPIYRFNPFISTIFDEKGRSFFADKDEHNLQQHFFDVSRSKNNKNSTSKDNFYDFLYNRAFPQDYFYKMTAKKKDLLKGKVKDQFIHSYDSYMNYAHPLDELNPIDCTGRGPDIENPENININDVLGGYQLTLVDSLDTLKIMNNETEFQKGIDIITETLHFSLDTTVHVFESTIRILGGLLSTLQLNTLKPEKNSKLLDLATNLGDRLMSAFTASSTSLPYPRVHLMSSQANTSRPGIPPGAIGGMLLEFTSLSRLTGNSSYENAIRNAVEKTYKHRTTRGLLGAEINVEDLSWSNSMSGIGAGIDSFYECLLKNYIAYGDESDLALYNSLKISIDKHLKPTDLCFPYINVNAYTGAQHNNWIDALSAFYPGLLVLDGQDSSLEKAICMHAHHWTIFNAFSSFPERYNFISRDSELKWYPLRPEFVESTYILYRATRNPFYQHIGEFILNSLINRSKTNCGFATIHNVDETDSLEDRMESFFLSETLKYLYLLFDEANQLNNRNDFVFSTEAHIINVNNTKIKTMFKDGTKKSWTFDNFSNKFSRQMIIKMNESSTYQCDNHSESTSLDRAYFLNLINKKYLPDRVVTFD